ncbi:MAG: glycosyltransferase family 4 protein [Candidatus Nanopelagicales bacterium]
MREGAWREGNAAPVGQPVPGYRVAVRIAFLNWRDTANPEGGGSEVYIEEIAQRLVERGHEVTLVCAAHGNSPGLEVRPGPGEARPGLRIIRRGTKLTVYREARRLLRSGALGPLDVIVDTQNGIPFFAPWATRTPVVVLVHHVHREQWPVVYDPLRARVGWLLESRLAPRVYRRSAYVAVSQATADELVALGVDRARIHVIHNGTRDPGVAHGDRDTNPRILVLGRLVPHKRVEHVLAAAARLRARFPALRIAVVGDGWWAPRLREVAQELGVADLVEFTGHVTDERKEREIDRSWVLALPSLKEGWGLVVLEAAARGVPAVAYRDAGGVTESIVDGRTGLLVSGGETEFTDALERVLADESLLRDLGEAARVHARQFSWDESSMEFDEVLMRAAREARRRD